MTILVTGLGAVTALGATAQETFDRIVAGERGFRELTLFDPGDVRSKIVAEVSDVEPSSRPTESRTSELALRAAREAIAHAGLDLRTRRVGLVLGGTTAGMFETESILATLLSTEANKHRGDPRREAALSRMLSHPLSAPTDRLAAELGSFTLVRSLSSACSSGANALGVAARWLELDLVDAVLCGAADSLCRVIVSGFSALGLLDPLGARPFDVRRRGLTLGEGAGMLVLERSTERRSRSRAVCSLLGWAARSEAHHITNPEASGRIPLASMRDALERAGLRPEDVDYVNAHGTGSSLNDSMEARALGQLFGEDVSRVRVSSQKGMIGHTLGAAGAIEAVITALAIERGLVPPTGGLEEPDQACQLRHVKTRERASIQVALSCSFGFGGMDTALVFGARDRESPPRPPRREVVVTGVSVVTTDGVFEGGEVAELPGRMASSTAIVGLEDRLDPAKSRRLDRSSRIGVLACERALFVGSENEPPVTPPRRSEARSFDPPKEVDQRSARAHRSEVGRGRSDQASNDDERVGLVLGIAFGAVDGTAEFMRRLRDKGPRWVRPADFPSLVPSSPAGHVSIYLGLTGPAFVVADLSTSGECAVAQAAELISAGDVDRVCAATVEERSFIVEEVLSVAFGEQRRKPIARREGGAAIALASADTSLPVLARLGAVVSFSDVDRSPLDTLPAPPASAIVVSEGAAELELPSSWSAKPRVTVTSACGEHEAAGGVAIAVAAAKIGRGEVSAALFVGKARGRGYAGTLWAPDKVT